MKNVNHRSPVALLLVDVVNHFEFPDGDRLLRNALPLVAPLARLKKRARRAGVPVIYVNDNFGQWQSDAGKLLAYCLGPGRPAREFVGPLQPDAKDYCVLKPMHSAFYQTPLDVLLRRLNVTSLVLAGLATNSCILCTAHDAKMRDYSVTVLSDGCAARTLKEHNEAIAHIRDMVDARIESAQSLRFDQHTTSTNDGRGAKTRKGRGDGR
jgi:nicotinamidase-related amidase